MFKSTSELCILYKHGQPRNFSPLLKWRPAKLFEHFRYAWGVVIPVQHIHRCSSLDHFQLVYASSCVLIPHRASIFYKRTHKCLVCCRLELGRFRQMKARVLFAFWQMFHLRLVVIVRPRYLTDGTVSRTMPFRVYWWWYIKSSFWWQLLSGIFGGWVPSANHLTSYWAYLSLRLVEA